MSRLSVILATVVAATATPVLAAPVIITVPGGNYVYEGTELPPSGPDVDVFPPPAIGAPFDPAQAAVNAMQHVPWAHRAHLDYADNAVLIRTLARTGDSLAMHWAKCQARYVTYNLADDTYTDSSGLPQNCRI
jgi:hypothetical protein